MCKIFLGEASKFGESGYWGVKSEVVGKGFVKEGGRLGAGDKGSKVAKWSSINFSSFGGSMKEKAENLTDHVRFLQTHTKLAPQNTGQNIRSKSAKKVKHGGMKMKGKKSKAVTSPATEKLKFNGFKNLNSKSIGHGQQKYYPAIEDLKYGMKSGHYDQDSQSKDGNDGNVDFKDYFQNACAEIIQKTWRSHRNRKEVQRAEKIKRIEKELNCIEDYSAEKDQPSRIKLDYSKNESEGAELVPICLKSSPKESKPLIFETEKHKFVRQTSMENNLKDKDNSLILNEICNNEKSRTIIGTMNSTGNAGKGSPKNTSQSKVATSSGEGKKDFVKQYKTFASDQIKRWENVINNIKDFQDQNFETQDMTHLEGMLDNLEKQGLVNLRILHEMIKVSKSKNKNKSATGSKSKTNTGKGDSIEKNMLFSNTLLEKLTENEKSIESFDKKNFSKKRFPENEGNFITQNKNYLLNNNQNHIKLDPPKPKNLTNPILGTSGGGGGGLESAQLIPKLTPKNYASSGSGGKNFENRANLIQDTLSSQYFEGESRNNIFENGEASAGRQNLPNLPKTQNQNQILRDQRERENFVSVQSGQTGQTPHTVNGQNGQSPGTGPNGSENIFKQNKREMIKSDGILINTDILDSDEPPLLQREISQTNQARQIAFQKFEKPDQLENFQNFGKNQNLQNLQSFQNFPRPEISENLKQKNLIANFIKNNNEVIEEFLEANIGGREQFGEGVDTEICERKIREILDRESGWVRVGNTNNRNQNERIERNEHEGQVPVEDKIPSNDFGNIHKAKHVLTKEATKQPIGHVMGMKDRRMGAGEGAGNFQKGKLPSGAELDPNFIQKDDQIPTQDVAERSHTPNRDVEGSPITTKIRETSGFDLAMATPSQNEEFLGNQLVSCTQNSYLNAFSNLRDRENETNMISSLHEPASFQRHFANHAQNQNNNQNKNYLKHMISNDTTENEPYKAHPNSNKMAQLKSHLNSNTMEANSADKKDKKIRILRSNSKPYEPETHKTADP